MNRTIFGMMNQDSPKLAIRHRVTALNMNGYKTNLGIGETYGE